MQAYEHILSTILSSKCNKEEALTLLKKYGAYFTYPDSVRAALACPNSLGAAYRQPSHFTDGATLKYIIDSDLKKKIQNGYPNENVYVPVDGLKLRASDGMTDLNEFKRVNAEILDTPEGIAILNHLYIDTCTDDFFLKKIAKCCIDFENLSKPKMLLYDVIVEDDMIAKLNYTGRTVSMTDFRKIILLSQKLSTLELFKNVRKICPTITFDEIMESVCISYDDIYPECMMNAKKYIVPSDDEQRYILGAIDDNDRLYYSMVEDELISMGAFNSSEQIHTMTEKLCYDTSFSLPVISNLRKIRELGKF